MTLFDYHTSSKERGIARAWAGTDDEWKIAALEAVRELCRTRAEFTTDELPEDIRTVREPRALGSLMVNARKAGLCKTTNITRESKSDKCHNRPKRVWRSCVYEGDE
jgi:hypothetical protein